MAFTPKRRLFFYDVDQSTIRYHGVFTQENIRDLQKLQKLYNTCQESGDIFCFLTNNTQATDLKWLANQIAPDVKPEFIKLIDTNEPSIVGHASYIDNTNEKWDLKEVSKFQDPARIVIMHPYHPRYSAISSREEGRGALGKGATMDRVHKITGIPKENFYLVDDSASVIRSTLAYGFPRENIFHITSDKSFSDAVGKIQEIASSQRRTDLQEEVEETPEHAFRKLVAEALNIKIELHTSVVDYNDIHGTTIANIDYEKMTFSWVEKDEKGKAKPCKLEYRNNEKSKQEMTQKIRSFNKNFHGYYKQGEAGNEPHSLHNNNPLGQSFLNSNPSDAPDININIDNIAYLNSLESRTSTQYVDPFHSRIPFLKDVRPNVSEKDEDDFKTIYRDEATEDVIAEIFLTTERYFKEKAEMVPDKDLKQAALEQWLSEKHVSILPKDWKTDPQIQQEILTILNADKSKGNNKVYTAVNPREWTVVSNAMDISHKISSLSKALTIYAKENPNSIKPGGTVKGVSNLKNNTRFKQILCDQLNIDILGNDKLRYNPENLDMSNFSRISSKAQKIAKDVFDTVEGKNYSKDSSGARFIRLVLEQERLRNSNYR